MSCQVIDAHYRRSPLVQGGLEIPLRVTVDMDIEESNSRALKKYEELVSEHCKEQINGMFDNVTALVLEALHSDDDSDTEESGGEGS